MITVAPCASTVPTMRLMLKARFSSWNLKFWHMLGRQQPSIKTLGSESLMSPTGRHECTYVVRTHCWSNKAYPVWLHWERLLEACSWFPLDFISCAFSLCWFTLHWFPIIKHSPEYGYTRSCMSVSHSPRPQSASLTMILGSPNATSLPFTWL